MLIEAFDSTICDEKPKNPRAPMATNYLYYLNSA